MIDPAFPWTHYRAASVADLPRVTIAVVNGKVAICTPKGDTAYSGIENPHKWNLSSVEDLLLFGYQMHAYNGASVAGVFEFVVPVNHALFGFGFSDYAEAFPDYRVQEYITAGDIDNIAAQRENNWQKVGGAVGNVNRFTIAAPAVLGDYSTGTAPNPTASPTFPYYAKIKVYANPGRWVRFTWIPSAATVAARKLSVVSGTVAPRSQNQNATDSYQFLVGDGVAAEFILDETFVFTTTPELWQIKKNGVTLIYTTDFTIVQTQDLKTKIVFVAVPADGDGLDARQYRCKYSAGAGYNECTIPPGRILIDGVVYAVPGQWSPVPTASFLFIGYDVRQVLAGIPNSLAFSGNFAGNIEAFPACWWFLPVAVTDTQTSPTNPSFVSWVDAFYLPTPAQQAAFEDAQDFAGVTPTDSDCGVLPTASHDRSGGLPQLLIGVKDRLLVVYRGGMQLWKFVENGNLNEKMDLSPIGFDEQLTPHGVQIDDLTVVPLVNGYRAISVYGQLSDGIDSDRLGEKIARFGTPQVHTAAWWPYLNEYVAFETVDGESRFRVLDYHMKTKEKVAAWARWYVDGVSSVTYKSLLPLGSKLYFRSGNKLHYFDAAATGSAGDPFRDSEDAEGFAYESTIEFRMNDFKNPNASKEVLGIDLIQNGRATFDFRTVGYDLTQIMPGPTINGPTVGKEMHGLAMMAPQFGVIVTSKDETGYELQQLQLHYTLWGR